MFTPVPMSRVQLLGLRKDQARVVEALHELGLVHLKECKEKGLDPEKASEQLHVVNGELLRLQAVRNLLKPQPLARLPARPLAQVLAESKALGLDAKLGELQREREQLDAEQALLHESRHQLGYFKDFHLDVSALQAASAVVLAGVIKTKKLHALRNTLASLTPHHSLAAKAFGKENTVLLLALDKRKESKVREALEGLGVQPLALPSGQGTPLEQSADLEKRLTELKKKRAALVGQIDALSKKHWGQLAFLIESLEIEHQRLKVLQKLGRTQEAFALEGFVPHRDVQALKQALARQFGEKLAVFEAATHEETPTLLDNPKILSPFQFMIEFMSLPQSHELDPTLMFALFFPIFYGAMLGDAGYGLVSLGLAYLVVKKTESGNLLNNVGRVWLLCSVPAIFFGFVYNEFFGFPHHELLGQVFYHGLERMEAVQVLLVLTVLLGLATMVIGYFLGFVNAFREKNYKHAIGKIGWIGTVLAGAALIATALFQVFGPEMLMTAGIVFAGSLLALLYAEGPLAIIEIPGVAGNILSYSRIAAVGLSSVIIALILNDLVLPKPEQGLLLLITVPLFLIGHLFNIVLGMFESLVQGARLNYVEFFSKFYQGGGEKFAPFRCERKVTLGGR